MSTIRMELSLGGLCAALAVITIVRCRQATVAVPDPELAVPAVWAGPAGVADSVLAFDEDLTVTNDPFRLSNAPAEVRFDPASEGSVGSPTHSIVGPRPSLVLKAIVGGPPWQAIIDGIPGQAAGTIAEQGKKFDKLTIRAVTRDSVVIQGPDTSWVLSFRRRS